MVYIALWIILLAELLFGNNNFEMHLRYDTIPAELCKKLFDVDEG